MICGVCIDAYIGKKNYIKGNFNGLVWLWVQSVQTVCAKNQYICVPFVNDQCDLHFNMNDLYWME